MRQDLIERARQGDREAFSLLAAGEVDRLHAIAWLTMRDRHLAEDAVQEALIRCWRQLPRLRDVGHFDGWLYRILMHAIADEFGRRRRFTAAVETIRIEPGVADSTRDVADREELERGFRKLSIDHRAVVVLHHYVGLSLPEAAAVLGIPPPTAKSRYRHAMSALRATLEAEDRRTARYEVLT